MLFRIFYSGAPDGRFGLRLTALGDKIERSTMMTDFSRRSRVKSDVAGAGGAMTFPAVASAAETKFDKEADVIVLGFGGAGAATAITAADNGASVIIIERQPQATLRSNTRMSGGIFHCPDKTGDRKA